MQWIKTLIIFLALFWGGDALCAQSQPQLFAKHITAPISSDTNSLLSRTDSINSFVLVISTNNQQLTSHNGSIPKTVKKTKYRCGSKRFKSFTSTRACNPVDIRAQRTTSITHRHTRYCCGRYCCGRKTWQQPVFETKALSNSSQTKNYPTLLPEAVLHSRHRSLCVIAPRE